jgi:hypothetical protein
MPFDIFFNHQFLQRNPPQTPAAAADLPSPFNPSQKSNVATNAAVQQTTMAHNNNNVNNNNVKNGE